MKSFLSSSKIFFLAGVLALGGAACGGDDDGATTTPDGAPGAADAAPGADAPTGPVVHEWAPIITAAWTLQPGQEKYVCASKTLTEDVYVGGYRPIDPLGTHHTVLTYGDPTSADNPGSDCSPGVENPFWIYASGVGTNELKLPAGVGVKIPKGQQVQVNLHLFNTSDHVITGTSGVEVFAMAQSEVTDIAEMFLPGPVPFQIPAATPQAPTQTISGDCTLHATQHLVALFPHMHQLGVHLKTEIVHADNSVDTLHDDDYSFDAQRFDLLNNVVANAGDKIRTTCTWKNTTGAPVSFGNSSLTEMCFSILIRWPTQGVQGAQGVLCPN
jgi:hypothetical protein